MLDVGPSNGMTWAQKSGMGPLLELLPKGWNPRMLMERQVAASKETSLLVPSMVRLPRANGLMGLVQMHSLMRLLRANSLPGLGLVLVLVQVQVLVLMDSLVRPVQMGSLVGTLRVNS